MKKFASIIILLLLTSSLAAEVVIPKSYQVENEEPGYCLWCGLEVVGRQQKVKPLYGLKEKRKKDSGLFVPGPFGMLYWIDNNPGHPLAVQRKLNDLGVHYRMQLPGYKDVSFLQRALNKGRAVVVGADHGAHALVLTHLDDKTCMFIDSNHYGDVYIGSRGWFINQWDGYAIEILDGK